MIETRLLTGVIPVVQTPLDSEGAIDTGAISRHIDWLDGHEDIGGYWALGTGSEDMNLTFAKRLEVARAICAANRGRKPLILGAGFFCMEDSLSFMDQTYDLEFDAYHVMPYHPLLSLDRLDHFYREIAEHARKPLWLYTSANWARPITPAFVAGLVDHSNIAGIKFSTQRTSDQIAVLSLASPGFQVITAVAKQYYVCLCMGAKGGTSSLGGAIPELMLAIYRAFKAGDHDAALAAQRRLNEFAAALPKGPKSDNFLDGAFEKYVLSKRGICQPYMTSYYREADEQERQAIDVALHKFGIEI